MGDKCCDNVCKVELNVELNETHKRFKKALIVALCLNVSMFFVEIVYGFLSNSLSLKADSIDFLGDSANYFITLFVLSSALQIRAKASLIKAASMFAFGCWVLFEAVLKFRSPELPDSFTMGWVGFLAFAVNASVAYILYKFRGGDSNMQSVWLCSRNDAIGNIAVLFASAGVYFTGSKWPDLCVAGLMAVLAVHSSYLVLKTASRELKTF